MRYRDPRRLLHISALGLLPVLAACGEAAFLDATSPLVRASNASGCATFGGPAGSTYNEFFGINNGIEIVGYAGGLGSYEFHPGKRYLTQRYPGSIASTTTSLNDEDTIAGWYQNAKGQINGFTEWDGIWTSYSGTHSNGRATRILGINESGEVVGYHEDRPGIDRAFGSREPRKLRTLFPPGVSFAATAINNRGSIVGWRALATGTVEGWLLTENRLTLLAYPGAVQTQPSGINDSNHIVGSYEDASGDYHGFILTDPRTSLHWQEFDDPKASGETVLTGIDDRDDLVGYYQDGSGRIVALLCR